MYDLRDEMQSSGIMLPRRREIKRALRYTTLLFSRHIVSAAVLCSRCPAERARDAAID